MLLQHSSYTVFHSCKTIVSSTFNILISLCYSIFLVIVSYSCKTSVIQIKRLFYETGNENLASSSGSNGGRTPSECNAG
jgi:hypothetical protein